jgi:nucleotide-binding universal stress UspA family protein
MTNRVVVGVDGSDHSKAALRWAATAATTLGCPLRVVAAWELPAGLVLPFVPGTVSSEELGQQAERDLAELVRDTVGDRPGLELRAVKGSAVVALLDEVSPDSLLVVGSRGRGGFRGLLLGSVSRECVEHAPCPVVVTRDVPPHRAWSGPVVVGVDLSDEASCAVGWAVELGAAAGLRVNAVHAWTPADAELKPARVDALREEAQARVDRWMQERWPDVARTEVIGDPRQVLRTTVEDGGASLLVLGRRGAGDLAPIRIGSVASHLVANCPVAVAIVHRDR